MTTRGQTFYCMFLYYYYHIFSQFINFCEKIVKEQFSKEDRNSTLRVRATFVKVVVSFHRGSNVDNVGSVWKTSTNMHYRWARLSGVKFQSAFCFFLGDFSTTFLHFFWVFLVQLCHLMIDLCPQVEFKKGNWFFECYLFVTCVLITFGLCRVDV